MDGAGLLAGAKRAAQTKAVVARVAEALLQRFACKAGMLRHPVDLVGQRAVKDAGIVGAYCQGHVGLQKAMDGVVFGVRHGPYAQIGRGAGLYDDAQFREAVEDEALALPRLVQARLVVGSLHGFVVWTCAK